MREGLQDSSNGTECLGMRQQVEAGEHNEHRGGGADTSEEAPINMEITSSSPALHGSLMAWQKTEKAPALIIPCEGARSRVS